jgi:hypothetical protein
MNYKKLLKLIFDNRDRENLKVWINEKYPHSNASTGGSTFASVLGWGQENGYINRENVVLMPHPAGGYQKANIQGDMFSDKAYEEFKPWYLKFWLSFYESCAKYWCPILLLMAINFLLSSLLPVIWSFFL